MTEEIIIDGVNVAGCDGLNKILLPLKQCNLLQFKTRDGGIAGRWCTDHSNCYYKQLQRLEQENKELKEDVLKWQKAFSRQYQINENKGYSKVEESYCSALEEIREIADKCKECLNEDDDCGYDYLRIKHRIEEVLGNENN